jgi:integrase/recombinase XerD
MANEDSKMLAKAIVEYLCLIISEGKSDNSVTRLTEILTDFLIYAIRTNTVWKAMFTFDTFREFRKYSSLGNTSHAIIALSEYLHQNGRIAKPLRIPSYQKKLPAVYEQYLLHLAKSKEIPQTQVNAVRRVLAPFHDYRRKHQLRLSALKIEHLDAFMAEFRVAKSTLKTYRHFLRGFLKYLYHERKLIKKDLAPLLVGAPEYDRKKPPKFLRPQEVQNLFSSLKLSTAVDIRTYVMVHLAYILGLRPVEISRLTLDDISFTRGEITIRERKTRNPVTLSLPEQTMKALAAYTLKARAKTGHRHLFLTQVRPHRPVSAGTVVGAIRTAMHEAGLSSSAYWLRHSYAQNLLGIGRSIYEIKEMLGHENIQSTQKYLHIDTERMRKVLFNETL